MVIELYDNHIVRLKPLYFADTGFTVRPGWVDPDPVAAFQRRHAALSDLGLSLRHCFGWADQMPPSFLTQIMPGGA